MEPQPVSRHAPSFPSSSTTARIASRFALLCAFCCLATSPARAALASLTYQPDPVDLNDLDHHFGLVPEVTPVVPAACLIISATMLELRRRRRAGRSKTA